MTDKENDLARITSFADEMGLEEGSEERDNFITSSMKRLGYEVKTLIEWIVPDGSDNKDKGDFFSAKRAEKGESKRPVTGDGGNYAGFRARSS